MTNHPDSILQDLRAFIASSLLSGEQPGAIADDDDLFATGILDSLALQELVAHIKMRFGVDPVPLDIHPRNFGSIRALAAYIESALSGSRRPQP
jgi:acyl carrier protein